MDFTKVVDSKKKISLCKFLKSEVTRSYFLEQYEERYDFKREQIYTFMKIPKEVERLICYGFFQVVDAFLFIFTFLPLRFVVAAWALFSKPLLIMLGMGRPRGGGRWLKTSEIIDLMKGFIISIVCVMISYIDTSMLYHVVKSQSIIKLYIFYNMLEVGDKLLSSLGQDTLDALHWTATEPRKRKRQHLGTLPHFFLAIGYCFLHSTLIMFQATVLNVAINSNNKALLTIMMSNNFVELKGSVFKKFDRNNLLQVSCSDIRERFHLCVLLLLVTVQTMNEFGWREEYLWVILPDCALVLIAELFVDWIKHAFITRFNEIPVEIYREYTLTLAYDIVASKQKYAFSDHSEVVSHRMGFISLPLASVTARILLPALRLSAPAAWLLLTAAYLTLATFRVLVTIVILGRACDLIDGQTAAAAPPAADTPGAAERRPRSRAVSECEPAAPIPVPAGATPAPPAAEVAPLSEPYNVFREFSAPTPAAAAAVSAGGAAPPEEGEGSGVESLQLPVEEVGSGPHGDSRCGDAPAAGDADVAEETAS